MRPILRGATGNIGSWKAKAGSRPCITHFLSLKPVERAIRAPFTSFCLPNAIAGGITVLEEVFFGGAPSCAKTNEGDLHLWLPLSKLPLESPPILDEYPFLSTTFSVLCNSLQPIFVSYGTVVIVCLQGIAVGHTAGKVVETLKLLFRYIVQKDLTTMSMLDTINPNAESISKTQARAVNVAAGVGLLNVLKSNLGPRGTLKLLVGGAGQLKLTKDGMVLLKEMQIQHPTACLIARTATAQDDVTGDGTTSTVLLCGELMRQADRHVSEGLHPRMLVEGLEIARDEALKFLQSTLKQEFDDMHTNRDLLQSIAMTSLGTKVSEF